MEADLFQDILSALQQQTNRIRLSLPNSCPIQKVVWSSFDYLRGPELEFVWEADYCVSTPTKAGGERVEQDEQCPQHNIVDEGGGGWSKHHRYHQQQLFVGRKSQTRGGGGGTNRSDNILEDGEMATADGSCTNSSTDSSFTTKKTGESGASTAQYEEIDGYYESELLQLSGDNFQNATQCFPSSSTCEHSTGVAHAQHHLIDELTMSSLNLSCQTDDTLRAVVVPSVNSWHTVAVANCANGGDEVEAVTEDNFGTNANNDGSSSSPDAMVTSCVDSGIGGTISIESNLSTYTKPDSRDEVLFNADDQRCRIKLQSSSAGRDPFAYHIPEAEEVIEFKQAYAESSPDERGPNNNSAPFTMPTQQQQQNPHHQTTVGGGCCSSSMLSSTLLYTTGETKNGLEKQQEQKVVENERLALFYREAEQLASEFALSDPSSNEADGLSDEAFVAKHVLAEQIGSIQFTSNPVLHKFCLVPSRHLCLGSYIFGTRRADQLRTVTNTLCAFTVVLPLSQSNWYLQRQSVFAEMFSDAIARFKAAALVDTFEDLICRGTREFQSMFSLFGALERWPLVTNCEQTHLHIQHSHLWGLNPMPNIDFVARCVTACLMCRGRCAVVGSRPQELAQLMHTLVAFMQPTDRLFCLRPYKAQFSPHLRLQAIKRSELHQFMDKVFTAHWPFALLDIDRRVVCFSGLYHCKHRAHKVRSQRRQIGQIFREAADAGADVPWQLLTELEQWEEQDNNGAAKDILETQIIQADPSVKELLELIHLMPLNRPARISFVDHFHLRMDNRAKALIAYVRDLSIPSPNDKRSAISSKWHLITVRKNLHLLSDASFGIVLSRADSLEPEFAEFIAQKTTNTDQCIHQ